jgi:hypothetical protein
VGLFVLRVAVGTGIGLLPAAEAIATPGQGSWTAVSAGVLGGMLVAGLLTPLSGLAIALLAVAGVAGLAPVSDPAAAGVLPAAVAVAIALLGPGAYSIDARLFGRREIVVSHAPRR